MWKQLRPAIVSVLAFGSLTGLVFPAVVTSIAQVVFPRQANGSMIIVERRVVGSALIGQRFTTPGYFHPRPSAAGAGYDATASGGSNLGPTNPKLVAEVARRSATYRTENDLAPDTPLPADAVTRSGSGLDPHISVANALLQAPRVARARGMSADAVRHLVAEHTEGRTFGLLGEPRINVLRLNLALDRVAGAGSSEG